MAGKRDEYVAKLKKQLDAWNADVERLGARAKAAKAEVKAQYEQRVADLREKRQDVERRLRDAREAGEGAWEALHQGLEDAGNALKSAIEKARSEFKERE